MESKKGYKNRDMFSAISFYAILFAGIAIFVSKLLVKLAIFAQIATICDLIASLLVYFVVAVSAFNFIRGKKIGYFIIYIICVVLIVVAYVLPLF